MRDILVLSLAGISETVITQATLAATQLAVLAVETSNNSINVICQARHPTRRIVRIPVRRRGQSDQAC